LQWAHFLYHLDQGLHFTDFTVSLLSLFFCRFLGVTTRKNSPDLMLVVNLYSPDDTYEQLYIANYAVLQLRDILARIDRVGDILVFGASEYSMRVWLDPDRMVAPN
jgi:multidrug efflux pump subunit AcrB